MTTARPFDMNDTPVKLHVWYWGQTHTGEIVGVGKFAATALSGYTDWTFFVNGTAYDPSKWTFDKAVTVDEWRDTRKKLAEADRVLTSIRTELYGQGFEILGWHMNGDTQPLDSWFEENEGWLE